MLPVVSGPATLERYRVRKSSKKVRTNMIGADLTVKFPLEVDTRLSLSLHDVLGAAARAGERISRLPQRYAPERAARIGWSRALSQRSAGGMLPNNRRRSTHMILDTDFLVGSRGSDRRFGGNSRAHIALPATSDPEDISD